MPKTTLGKWTKIQTDEESPPSEGQVAQALCLADCVKRGFEACTWYGAECLDASAQHYHEKARKALARWNETFRV